MDTKPEAILAGLLAVAGLLHNFAINGSRPLLTVGTEKRSKRH